MSEREMMLSGKPYQPWAQELEDDRDRARQLIERYNTSKSSDKAQRSGIIASLFGKIDKEHPPHLESPFYCDYVSIISLLSGAPSTTLPERPCCVPYCSPNCFQVVSGVQPVSRQGLLLQFCLRFTGRRQDHHRRQSALWTQCAPIHAHASFGPC